jgi:H+/gluconate symporter-like permease
MGFIGIVVSLSLLIFFAYRGVAVVLLAPVLAMLAVWMEGSLELLPAYTNVFMVEMGSFIAKLFPLFLLGSIFGKLLEKALFAESIAQFLVKKFGKGAALVSIITACGILTYGGVSAFVVCFSMVPLARRAFSAAKISHRLIPGALACGALTFSMTCLPGTVQVHNLIPMSYFKTTPFAAPLLGILGGLAMFLLGVLWMEYRKKKESFYEVKTTDVITVPTKVPDFIMAISPIVLVIALNWIFSESRWNVGNWSIVSEKFKEIDPAKFKGTWATVHSARSIKFSNSRASRSSVLNCFPLSATPTPA